MDRRTFIRNSLVLSGGVIGVAALFEACSKSGGSPAAPTTQSANFTIDISTSQYNALQKNGNAVYYTQASIIIARDKTGKFVALSAICTHAGCNIQFNGVSQFPCPCHGSIFDENGNVVQGPATTGVQKFNTSLSGNQLHVWS